MGHLKIVVLSLLVALMGCEEGPSNAINDIENSLDVFLSMNSQGNATEPCIEFGVSPPPSNCSCPEGGEIVVEGDPQFTSLFEGCATTGLVYNGRITETSSVYEYVFNEFGECVSYQGKSPIECQGDFIAVCGGFELFCNFLGVPGPGEPCDFEC